MRKRTAYVVAVREDENTWEEYVYDTRKTAFDFAEQASKVWGVAMVVHEVRGQPQMPLYKFVQGHLSTADRVPT